MTAAQATNTSNQQWRAAVQNERALELHVRSLRKGVHGVVSARFGAEGAQNLQFGFAMAKPRTKSAEVKAAAVAKWLATREKRGTLGKVQKKDIKGNVSVELVVTPAADTAQAAAQPTTTNTAPQATSPAPAGAPPQAPPAAAPVPSHTGGTA